MSDVLTGHLTAIGTIDLLFIGWYPPPQITFRCHVVIVEPLILGRITLA